MDIDKHWRYYLICVGKIDPSGNGGSSLGLMFDVRGNDPNAAPREGAAISAHSHLSLPQHTTYQGNTIQADQAKEAYFRTAIHEWGHMLSFRHPGHHHLTYMQQTGKVMAAATEPNPFPNNIDFQFSPRERERAVTWPDVMVRPGTGVEFDANAADEFADTAGFINDNLTFEAWPCVRHCPLGAPIRFELRLENRGSHPIESPNSIGFKGGYLTGMTVSQGEIRTFRSLLVCVEEDHLNPLPPGDTRTHAVTLMRGLDGPLFPSSGFYHIHFHLDWESHEGLCSARCQTSVLVGDVAGTGHGDLAYQLLHSDQPFLVLALGANQLTEGSRLIQESAKNPILKPHYAYIEAYRHCRFDSCPNSRSRLFAKTLRQASVLNSSEKSKVIEATQTNKIAKPSQAIQRLDKLVQGWC